MHTKEFSNAALKHLNYFKIFAAIEVSISYFLNTEFEEKQIRRLLKFANLQALRLRLMNDREDLFEALSIHDTLQILELNQVRSLNWIPIKLTTLILSNTEITDWTPLTRLQNLQEFGYYSGEQFPAEMMQLLATLPLLERLTFGQIASVDGAIENICKFSYHNLTSLVLSCINTPKDAALHLQKLTMLKHLQYENSLKHLSALAHLTNLTDLSLTNCNTENFKLLAKSLTKLTGLSLHKTPHQLAGIGLLQNVEKLLLCSEDLVDRHLATLADLYHLSSLTLTFPRNITTEGLQCLTHLTSLQNLSYCGTSELDKTKDWSQFNFTIKKGWANDFY
jgi:hypothetical protein